MVVFLTHNFTSQGTQRAPNRWQKATSPPQELEGGAHSAPNYNLTSQGARSAPIWWPKATSPLQEQQGSPHRGPNLLVLYIISHLPKQTLYCLKLIYKILEDLAPYGGQTSSSCGGLVAFGHQMGALRAPWTNTNSYIAQIHI